MTILNDLRIELERMRNTAEACLSNCDIGLPNNPDLGYYNMQVRNHIRRVMHNCDEALDYLKFVTGEKQVNKITSSL